MSESIQQRPPVQDAPMEKAPVQMKVSHLLAAIISLMWLLVFIATLAIVVNSTRDYLQRAMESHAQDTATSLGLSITHSAKTDDVATIDTMANAIFDRGYYREILVRKSNGQLLVSKRLEEAVQGVPEWFIKNFPLNTPRMDATVMDGWRQAARIEVRRAHIDRVIQHEQFRVQNLRFVFMDLDAGFEQTPVQALPGQLRGGHVRFAGQQQLDHTAASRHAAKHSAQATRGQKIRDHDLHVARAAEVSLQNATKGIAPASRPAQQKLFRGRSHRPLERRPPQPHEALVPEIRQREHLVE